jgi:hypothetical protein
MLDEGNYKGINAQTSDDELSGIEKEMVQIRESEQQRCSKRKEIKDLEIEEGMENKNSFNRNVTITTKRNATANNTTTTTVTNKRNSLNTTIKNKNKFKKDKNSTRIRNICSE